MSNNGKPPRVYKGRSLQGGDWLVHIHDPESIRLCEEALNKANSWDRATQMDGVSMKRVTWNVKALRHHLLSLERCAFESDRVDKKDMTGRLTKSAVSASELTHAQMAELDDDDLIEAIFSAAEPNEIVARINAISDDEDVSSNEDASCSNEAIKPITAGHALDETAAMLVEPVTRSGAGVTGVAHVNSSFNNTKVLISDCQGNAISWSSAGTMGFKGSRKCTPYAAQVVAEDAGRKAQKYGIKTLEVEVQGSGRESTLHALASIGFNIKSVRDVAGSSITNGNRHAARTISIKKSAS